VEKDELDFAYLTSVKGEREFCMRIGVVGADEEVGEGRFAHLDPCDQEHVLWVEQGKLPEWFDHVGDAVQDDIIDWIAENVGHSWSVRGHKEDDDDAIILLYSFANSADAVAFKLRWADRIRH
jgi:hypothetical protein